MSTKTADQTGHTLVITQDEDEVRAARENGEAVNLTDQSFLVMTIRCHHDPQDWTRDCMTWWECDCTLTDAQRGDLYDDGDGPCPTSPTGRHRLVGGAPKPHQPSQDCWAVTSDDTADAASHLVDEHKLGPGEHPVKVHCYWDGPPDFELATTVVTP